MVTDDLTSRHYAQGIEPSEMSATVDSKASTVVSVFTTTRISVVRGHTMENKTWPIWLKNQGRILPWGYSIVLSQIATFLQLSVFPSKRVVSSDVPLLDMGCRDVIRLLSISS